MLASDEDREQAVRELTEHHVQGRLSSDEFSQRSELAYGARTSGELDVLLSDLPGRPTGAMVVWEGLRSLRPTGPRPGFAFVGFWPRTAALWADFIALGALGYGTQLLVSSFPMAGPISLFTLVYFVVLWATTGRTLGLWLVGARVVRQEDGRRLGLRRSLIRMLGFLFDTATLLTGFLWVGVDRRKQGWHDKMAGSYVVRRLT